MFDKFNSVPFDDRVNRKATIDNIRHYSLPKKSPMRQIQNWILEISGVLMFAEHPEKFIPGSYIELIRFNTKEAEASDDFIEKTFTGPIWKQVQDALDYINTNVIEEKVVKLQGQAESERFLIIHIMPLKRHW